MQLAPIPTLPSRLASRGIDVLPGVLLCALIAAIATVIGACVPLVGSAIPAVVIGVLVAMIRKPAARLAPGIGYAGKFVLQCAVVLLGAQLSLASIIRVGAESLPVMLSSLAMCLLGAWVIGRALGVDRDLRVLLGVGTGICGASAIAAISPVIRAKSADIAYAISTVFLFNILAVLIFPVIGHALGMSPHAFGLFAGTAVNDTSSVVAAASVFSASALGFAVVVKLVRTLMIIPISVGLAVLEGRRTGSSERLTPARILKLVPWFLIGFLVVATLTSFGAITETASGILTTVSVFLVATALAGIGLSTDLGAIRTAGLKPLLLGGILSLLVAVTTLSVMAATGAL
ncbi:putative integral membrane protein (TIGR00698 family) [Leucobacter luti]|uniref:YeiH family protein n=1 Tax=Leucobacter luti TaxID=340320 RepID=UPI001047A532|nr:putative sulfate exporter family transporter [Leucobacter luti]MCW2288970.1 putative integral membrane protein (TIGR00698 family) [Leucobacter luti]TCK44880.1 putative integral membrane protein (TIGR00698 family) [Leucobacter luti]